MRTYITFAMRSWRFLTPGTRRKFISLSPLLLLGAIGELVAVLALGALTAVAFRVSTNDSRPTRIEILVDRYFPLELSSQQLILLLVSSSIFLLASKTSFMMFVNFKVANFLAEEEALISSRIFKKLLTSSIDDGFEKSSGEYQYLILNATSRLMNSVMLPLLNLSSDIFTVFFLVLTAILVSPITGLGLLFLILLIYVSLNKILGRKSHAYGELIAGDSIRITDLISASIRGRKELRVYQVSDYLINSFTKSRSRLARVVQRSNLINGIFRFVADLVILLLGVFILAVQLLIEVDLRRIVSILILYLAIGYRLLPAIQRVQGTLTSLRLSRPALEPLLDSTSFNFSQPSDETLKVKRSSVVEPASVVMRDLSFEYISENVKSKKLINNLNLQLAPGKLLVLWGRSGTGKTTLLDILAGLREPTCGIIRYENSRGEAVDNIAKSYVGQEPFLSKGKLTESLLLGLEIEDDSISELKRIFGALNLEGAINDLDSFELLENSTNVSGGEKQRLSIARALAIPSSIVFMDEPTSALDQKNHDSVIKLIKSQIGNKTMIIATHDQQIKFLADEVISLGDAK